MRKLTKAEKHFYAEITPSVVAVREKRRNRKKNRSLYVFTEARKQPIHYTGTVVCLIRNGFTYEEALDLLR